MARRQIGGTLAVLAAPTVLAIVISLVLMNWHKATRVEVILTVDRAALTVAPAMDAELAATLLDAGRMSAVRVDRVARVTFEPDTLEMANEARFDLKKNRFPDDAWQPLAVSDEVVLTPIPEAADSTPAATLQPEEDTARIRSVRSRDGSRVVMELGSSSSGKQPWMTLALDTASAVVDLVFPALFLLFADYMRLDEVQGGNGAPDSLSFRAGSDTNTAVRIEGSERGLVMQLEPSGSGTVRLAEAGIPVSTVDFTHQGPSGECLSSLVGAGSLSYPDLPSKGALKLGAGEFVSLEGLERARIESLSISHKDGQAGLKVTLDAVADLARIGTPEQPRDARLTWFDVLWHSPVLAILFAIVVWMFPTTLAGYKLWKELRSSSESS